MSGKVIASSDIIGVIPAANLPPSGGGAPQNAPYLLNGVDPSGLLTAEVNVLALATPQPFIATAPIAGDVGLPITLAYDNGVGAVGTGVGLQFKAQNAADATKDIATVITRLTDATAATEDSEVDIQVLAAGADQTALTIANGGLLLGGTGAKTIVASTGGLTVSATGAAAALTGGTSAAVTGATTATVQAGSGAATLQSTAAGAAVLGQTTASLTATTGAASVVASAAGASVTGATTAAVQAGTGNATLQSTAAAAFVTGQIGASLTATTGNATIEASGLTGNVFLTANGKSWNLDPSDGSLNANPGPYQIRQVAPGAATGDVLVYQQLLGASVIAPTAGGPAVAADPGAIMAQTVEIAVTAVAGVYLVTNNTGAAIRIIGAEALLPATFAAAAISVETSAVIFAATALAALNVPALPCAAGYTSAAATVANGASFTINAVDATLGAPATAFVIVKYQVG